MHHFFCHPVITMREDIALPQEEQVPHTQFVGMGDKILTATNRVHIGNAKGEERQQQFAGLSHKFLPYAF